MRRSIAALGAAALVGLMAGPASAHVTANPNEAPTDSFFKTSFRVGHGCDGSPTTSVTVQIPDGVVSVKPQAKPGWEIETVVGDLSEPVEMHGQEITEGVQEITWTAEVPLPDEYHDDFGVSMRLPDRAGETLYFPFVQECEEGEHAWIEIPDTGEQWGDLEEPAPYLSLAAAGGGHGAEDEEVPHDATEDTASTDDSTATAAVEEGTDPLVWVALAAGLLGLITGAAGLMASRRNS